MFTDPIEKRHESIPCGGGTGFFKDKEGNWWCSYFGNDSQSHFREKIGFIRADFTSDGLVYPAKEQPFVDKKDRGNMGRIVGIRFGKKINRGNKVS